MKIKIASANFKKYNELNGMQKLDSFLTDHEIYEGEEMTVYHHTVDDWRRLPVVDNGRNVGEIKVSCDGAYAAFLGNDGSVKLAKSPYQLYDRWLKAGSNRIMLANYKPFEGRTDFYGAPCEEPAWIAEGYWELKGRGKQIVITKFQETEAIFA
ncbi:hypothetical protein MA9V2_039 [Chryseobacterium phage MA9V-2]|nr:hypothetical protein MA9V2_039 [Chryseobacterium phage MA9V-2]